MPHSDVGLAALVADLADRSRSASSQGRRSLAGRVRGDADRRWDRADGERRTSSCRGRSRARPCRRGPAPDLERPPRRPAFIGSMSACHQSDAAERLHEPGPEDRVGARPRLGGDRLEAAPGLVEVAALLPEAPHGEGEADGAGRRRRRPTARSRATRMLSCSCSRRLRQLALVGAVERPVAAASASSTNQAVCRSRIGRRVGRAPSSISAANSRIVSSISKRGGSASIGPDQALVGERDQPVEDIADPLGRRVPRTASAASSSKPPAKTDSRSRSRRSRLVEDVVAPGDRAAEGLLAGRQVARAGGEEVELVLEPGQDRVGRRSFTRAAASSIASGMPWSRAQIAATAGRVLVRDREVGLDRDRPGDEQADGLVGRQVGGEEAGGRATERPARSRRSGRVGRHRQARDGVLLLARDVERRPRGREDLEVRAPPAGGRR